jgi:hypothetical protein
MVSPGRIAELLSLSVAGAEATMLRLSPQQKKERTGAGTSKCSRQDEESGSRSSQHVSQHAELKSWNQMTWFGFRVPVQSVEKLRIGTLRDHAGLGSDQNHSPREGEPLLPWQTSSRLLW